MDGTTAPSNCTTVSRVTLTISSPLAGLKLVIWENKPLAANREALAAMGYESVVFEPAANRTAAGDYLQIMTANADRMRKANR